VAARQLNVRKFKAYRRLQRGMDIAKKQDLGILVLGRNLRLKFLEDVQFGEICLSFVEVLQVLPAPTECATLRMFDPPRVHSTVRQHPFVLGCEVFSYNGNYTNI